MTDNGAYLEIQDATKPQRTSCADFMREWLKTFDNYRLPILILQVLYSAFVFYCANLNREHSDALSVKNADVPPPMDKGIAMWVHFGFLFVRYLIELQFCWSCRTQFPKDTPKFIWAIFAFRGLQLICQCLIAWSYVGRNEPMWSAMIAAYACLVFFRLLEWLLHMRLPFKMNDDCMPDRYIASVFMLSRVLVAIPASMLVLYPKDGIAFLCVLSYWIFLIQSYGETEAIFVLGDGRERDNSVDFGEIMYSSFPAVMMLWLTNDNAFDSVLWICLQALCAVHWLYVLLCLWCRHPCVQEPTDQADVPV